MPRVLDNPAEGYTREVKAALVDAMIENSGPLTLGPEEWLTVAARDNVPRDPLIPGDTADFSTIIFRVKGSDLAAFRAGRMTLEEARQKVEVRRSQRSWTGNLAGADGVYLSGCVQFRHAALA